ncbi:hypothetical protein GOODEAATRI_019718 [Goodea atripinnis]|uniref:Secreted protein n=1 Tax=Goodea atripinnis TaxID=208336 RepID=A0ABV0NW56_9TELE
MLLSCILAAQQLCGLFCGVMTATFIWFSLVVTDSFHFVASIHLSFLVFVPHPRTFLCMPLNLDFIVAKLPNNAASFSSDEAPSLLLLICLFLHFPALRSS